MFSLTRFCPMYSSSRRGRTLTSMRASSSYAAPETMRCGCLGCIIRFVEASAIPIYLSSPRGAAFRSAQRLQRSPQQLLEICRSCRAFRFRGRVLRRPCVVSQIHERGNHIRFDACRRSDRRLLCFYGHRFELVFQLDHDALRRFSADTRDFRQAHQIAAANCRNQFFHVYSGKNLQRQRRADARSGNQQFKKMLLARGNKTKERQRVFPDVRMNQKGDFRMQLAQRRVCRKRHLHQVPDAAHVDEHLIRSFFRKPSAQLPNHLLLNRFPKFTGWSWEPVLPPFLRLSTNPGVCGVCVYYPEKGTTPLEGLGGHAPSGDCKCFRSFLATESTKRVHSYSYRKATMGSTREARRAGKSPARIATLARMDTAMANESVSAAPMPKS